MSSAHTTSKKSGSHQGFTALNADRILLTLEKINLRINERFPASGLKRVCMEFLALAHECSSLSQRLARPIWPVRLLSLVSGIALVYLTFSLFYYFFQTSNTNLEKWHDIIQTVESGINEMIFLSLALFFLIGLETRVKRRMALRTLHKLRSIAHVIDMHQLTKDPAYILSRPKPTKSSPERNLSRNELMRYLDYCSEMLAINSKLAALFVQSLNDPAILSAVNELESLTQGLSSKIWQKIMILDLSDIKE